MRAKASAPLARNVSPPDNQSTVPGQPGTDQGLVGIGRDITERKQAEEELHRLNQGGSKTLSKCNEVVVRATDENTLLTKICRIITEIGGFRLAWVGYSEQDESKSVRPVAWAGAGAGYLEICKSPGRTQNAAAAQPARPSAPADRPLSRIWPRNPTSGLGGRGVAPWLQLQHRPATQDGCQEYSAL